MSFNDSLINKSYLLEFTASGKIPKVLFFQFLHKMNRLNEIKESMRQKHSEVSWLMITVMMPST